MFFSVGSYWLFHDGSWYRGANVRGPWVQEPHPPWEIRKIDQPYAFTHYRREHPHDQTATKTETASPDLNGGRKNRMFQF